MNRVVQPPPPARRKRSPGGSTSTVSVLRWPTGGASGGVFEMFSAREPGWFGSLAPRPSAADGENLLLVSASSRTAPHAPAVLLSLVNTSPCQAVRLAIKLAGRTPTSVRGTVITTPPLDLRRGGTAATDEVSPTPFHGAQLDGKVVEITVPARSVVVLTVAQAAGKNGRRRSDSRPHRDHGHRLRCQGQRDSMA